MSLKNGLRKTALKNGLRKTALKNGLRKTVFFKSGVKNGNKNRCLYTFKIP
jgi:hypothetical protein